MTAEQGLIHENIQLLRQGEGVLRSISDGAYTAEVSGISSAAKHFRHIFNHYEALLMQRRSIVDYETRERGTEVERRRDAALAKTAELVAALHDLGDNILRDTTLSIERVIRLADGQLQKVFYPSNLSRELDFLQQHAVHHFAMIAIILRQQGAETPQDFGMSPSTLRFNAALAVT